MLKNWLFLFVGGGLGAIGREALMVIVAAPLASEGIDFLPVFVANMVASFLIGTVTTLVTTKGPIGPEGKLFLATGVMGGLSTFSSFIWGAENTFGDPTTQTIGLLYIGATMIFGFLMVQLGLWLGQRFTHDEQPAI